jgi:hypothetical protein
MALSSKLIKTSQNKHNYNQITIRRLHSNQAKEMAEQESPDIERSKKAFHDFQRWFCREVGFFPDFKQTFQNLERYKSPETSTRHKNLMPLLCANNKK